MKFKSERLKMGIQNPTGDMLAVDSVSNIKRMINLKADRSELERI